MREFAGVAFDDYGTGCTSLIQLKEFPLTRLKIDQSVVRNLQSNSEDGAVIGAILYLAKSFELDVIAEGIATEEQESILASLVARTGRASSTDGRCQQSRC